MDRVELMFWRFWDYQYPDKDSSSQAYERFRDWGKSMPQKRFCLFNAHGQKADGSVSAWIIIMGTDDCKEDDPPPEVVGEGVPIVIHPDIHFRCLIRHYQSLGTSGFTEKRDMQEML